MTEKQFNYLRILNQQLNKGVITKKYFKKEAKLIREISKK
jgi:hypothetical protein